MSSRPRPCRLAELVAAAALVVVGVGAPSAHSAAASSVPASASTTNAAPVDAGGPRWLELSASQHKVLAPLMNDWNGLDSRSKERWLEVAGRFPRMPADEQQRANERMVEWSHMTVAQRMQARMNFQASRSVSKEERDARWKAYQALPEDKKRELGRRAAAAASASAIANGPSHRHAPTPGDAGSAPRKAFAGAAPASAKPASGTAPAGASLRPGVTTTLLTRRASPPAHQRDGQPKIAAGPTYVDNNTLLPKHPAAQPASAGAPVAKVGGAASTPSAAHP